MGKNVGFTVVEITIALSIMAVAGGLSVPVYLYAVEQSRSTEAQTTLHMIHMQEKIYKMDHGTYWGPETESTTLNEVNEALLTDLSGQYFTNIEFTDVTPTGYTCRVKRNASAGGDTSRYFQLAWDESTAALTKTEGHAPPVVVPPVNPPGNNLPPVFVPPVNPPGNNLPPVVVPPVNPPGNNLPPVVVPPFAGPPIVILPGDEE